MILSCPKCGAVLVFNMRPVDWPKDASGAYCSGCERVYAVMLEVVKESPLSHAELKQRRVVNT